MRGLEIRRQAVSLMSFARDAVGGMGQVGWWAEGEETRPLPASLTAVSAARGSSIMVCPPS